MCTTCSVKCYRRGGDCRKRGGQPGHKGSHRELLPAEQVDKVIDLFPSECENCWKPLPNILDPAAKRYQHIELPPIKPHVTEVRRHTVGCLCCGYDTCGASRLAPTTMSPRRSRASGPTIEVLAWPS